MMVHARGLVLWCLVEWIGLRTEVTGLGPHCFHHLAACSRAATDLSSDLIISPQLRAAACDVVRDTPHTHKEKEGRGREGGREGEREREVGADATLRC